MNSDTNNIDILIEMSTKLIISYDLPGSTERQMITLVKDNSKEFKEELRKAEDYLATKRAKNIVYKTISDY